MFAHKLIRSILVLSLVSAVPAAAMAGEGDRREHRDDARGKGEKRFPMEAAKFREKAEARIAKGRARLEKALERREVPPGLRQKALAKFEEGAKQVRGAIDRVAKDGTVTKDEAQEVRELARSLRREAIEGRREGKRGEGKRGHRKHDDGDE